MQIKPWQRRGAALALLLVLASVTAWGGESRQVVVKEAVIRHKPMIFSKKLTAVGNGTWLEALETKGAWVQVRLPDGRSGWVQQSALAEGGLELKAGSRPVATAASDEELTLAGKGFNSEVEKEFRRRNQAVDYRWIERMETFSPSDGELQRFLAEGELTPQGGDDAR